MRSGTPGRDERERPLRRDALANQERVLAAAVTVVRREGPHVPMATIAAEAGVGVATLYRRYPDRGALLDALTQRSFELLMEQARAAEDHHGDALGRVSWWWDRAIDLRDQLVLPLGGGPPLRGARVRLLQSQLHESLQRLLEAGQRDGSIRGDVTTGDVIIFGAMLVTPLPGAADWGRAARRQKRIYLDGLSTERRGPSSLPAPS